MVPGGKLADYVLFVMAQPDVKLPILLSTVLTLLKTRTAVDISKAGRPLIAMELRDDPRFQKVDRWHWDLKRPKKRDSGRSAINYIVEVLQQPDVKLPISMTTLVKLLKSRTDINPFCCGFKTLHSAMTRDARLYQVDSGLWMMKKTLLGEKERA